MTTNKRVRVAMIGCGGMARHHIRMILQQQDTSEIAACCEPSPGSWAETAAIFKEAGLQVPPNQPDLKRLLADYGRQLDAAFIVSPHVYHHDQAKACLEAGLDVLLEKPMVMNAGEARSLIQTRDRTGKLLVVAFPGSLSPQLRTAVSLLRSGEIGPIKSISALAYQEWGPGTVGSWRQQPEIAGGGFLFDTGAHMLNTVADLAGEDFVEVAAWLDNHGRPVDTLAAVIGRLESGPMVTICGCGESSACASEVYVFTTKAVLRTGIWGERLEIQRLHAKRLRKVKLPPSRGVWEQFLAVRSGQIPNPCPPEVGLRMAKLWDAIKASSARNGVPVACR